jgi:glycosyltransferase involved in cell wall biosynthesis
LDEADFEIVVVDDASTDGTAKLIDKLAREHGNIRKLSHPSNRGGGAARNTGIRNSYGRLIYCLDSDNFFGPGQPLKKMLEDIDAFGLDGVSFYERRFIVGNNHKHYESYFNEVTDRDIEPRELFADKAVLLDNFLYTKESYLRTKGYPEHHGFDTQCFEVRYLAAGNRVRACKDTIFYHRQAMGSKSYFEREYDKGNFSKNYLLIMEDVFGSLSPAAKEALLGFDIFSRSSMSDNLMLEMKRLQSKGLLFKSHSDGSDGRAALVPAYIERYESSLKSYNIGSYEEALKEIHLAIDSGLKGKIAEYHEQRCLMGKEGVQANDIDDMVSDMAMFTPKKQRLYKIYHRMPVVSRMIAIIIKWKKIK